MSPIETIKTAISSLGANKLRAGLALLGIVIGVTAVITLMSIGRGATEQITGIIQGLGTNLLFVQPSGEDGQLTLGDAEALVDPVFAPTVLAAAPEIRSFATLAAGRENRAAQVVGVTPEYLEARNLDLASGMFIKGPHVSNRDEVIVLGSTVAEQLFQNRDPVGGYVRVNGRRFQVIGLLESQGASMTDLLRNNLCTSVGMVDVGVFVPLYAYDNPDPGTAPTITGFTMSAGRLSGDPDAQAVMDSVAVVPGGEWEKIGKTYPEIVSGPIPMTQQAGPLIFLTGYSGRDQANFPIVTFDQLRDHGKLMGLGHFDDPESETMMCQAWHIYRTYQRLLTEAGSDISRVVHQVLYLVDVSKLGALERVARVIYDGKVPPTTVIGADEIGPYPELQLEIDVVAIPS